MINVFVELNCMTEYRAAKLVYCTHTDCVHWCINAKSTECVISCTKQDWKFIMVQIPIEDPKTMRVGKIGATS